MVDTNPNQRQLPDLEAPQQRIRHSGEFETTFTGAKTATESSRCMGCGTPFCRSRCPLSNDISGFNEDLVRGDWHHAFTRLRQTNPFPEWTGRVCPAPCESSCVLGLINDPVSIERVERSIADHAAKQGWDDYEKPEAKRTESIAIVGSGPAGLAAAHVLGLKGYQVTVYDRMSEPGGLLRHGIPGFKLEKSLVRRRVDQLKKLGVVFHTGISIGRDVSLESLQSQFDAVLMACGSTEVRRLAIETSNIEGVHYAEPFLRSHISVIERNQTPPTTAKGKIVLVIGGGDTGADCVGVANRQGARHVMQLEIRDQSPQVSPYPRLKDEAMRDSWPDVPDYHIVSTSHLEGVEHLWAQEIVEIVTDPNDQITGVKTRVIDWSQHRDHRQQSELRFIPCDIAIVAIGYENDQLGRGLKRVGLHNWQTTRSFNISKNLYVAGDMRTGASLVVNAIAEGMRAAAQIHEDIFRCKSVDLDKTSQAKAMQSNA